MINSLFPRVDGYWVGDVMPMTSPDGETLELFYLFDKNNNGNSVMHPFHMFSTDNFYEFRNNGLFIASTDDPRSQDYFGLGTGCFFTDGNILHCFYTGVNNNISTTTAIMHATSSDGGKTWDKLTDETLYPPDGYDKSDFRDAQIEKNESTGEYMLLVGGRTDRNTKKTWSGVVLYYTSKDLHNWTFKGNLFEQYREYMCECPDIQKIGDKYYLFWSWNCYSFYAVADSIEGPYSIPADDTLSGDGFTFYAAKAGELKGSYYLCAWIGRKRGGNSSDYDWGGNMVIFEIHQNENGTLGLDTPHTYSEYFNKDYEFVPVKASGSASVDGNSLILSGEKSIVDMGVLPETMMLTCKFRVSSYFARGGLCFGSGEAGDDSYYIMLNASKNRLEYNARKLGDIGATEGRQGSKVGFKFAPDTEYTLKVVTEGEYICLYLNGEKTLINRIYGIKGYDWGFFASDGTFSFYDIEIKVTDAVTTEPGEKSEKTSAISGRPVESSGKTTEPATEDNKNSASGNGDKTTVAPETTGTSQDEGRKSVVRHIIAGIACGIALSVAAFIVLKTNMKRKR
ncbi:MAG: DUF4975 domain-containing protein [Clostridia bacterium]|nr:DUF4975 domain-containing protein [Clostridia bacterium]